MDEAAPLIQKQPDASSAARCCPCSRWSSPVKSENAVQKKIFQRLAPFGVLLAALLMYGVFWFALLGPELSHLQLGRSAPTLVNPNLRIYGFSYG